ncbi:MAG: DNA helicase [Firmicutes bacterium HGW-Firmicutes-7]|nr:MAG: DNA helicase [Firmicutes bacterium HGW-Firmicutes-7]
MIHEIKTIVNNYLNNVSLCDIILGTVTSSGIKISDKLTIPNELVIGNLKSSVIVGNKVRLLRNHGGQQFYILEVVK